MADIGYTLASKLIEVLAGETIQKICILWNYESQLEKLRKTVSRIQKMFLVADASWEHLNEQQRDFIKELRDVVYDAEDVFDEFHTRAQLNQLGKKSKVRKFFGKVRCFFSFDKNQNQVIYANKVAADVKDIMERLDDIACDHTKFNLQLDNRPIVRRPEETCSYVDAHRIVGRDKDKEEIIRVLLDPDFQNNFCFYPIVGMGGLGKTALAQLVFNDEKIQAEFPDPTYRLWVCVSDQDREQFDEKVILCKILELIAKKKSDNDFSKQSIQQKFEEKIRNKKYVLVLDDVWNEDREKWLKLESFLRMGCEGSKIIVTTRSEQTASIIGSKQAYRLGGLSQEDSRCLFEMSAFGQGEKNNDFLHIGEKIVEKCHRNPLAIKVVGSYLFGQDIIKWRSIERRGLADIDRGNIDRSNSDKILPILKLSYYSLAPSLKSCFSYCALFPKDFQMNKEMLFDLWLAQGYIVPLVEGQSLEEAFEDHFSILMRRCFFQDIVKDRFGNIFSVKIHDLMHDVAQEVGKEEICVITSKACKLGEKVRHVNIDEKITNISLCSHKIRTYGITSRGYEEEYRGYEEEYVWDKNIEKLTALRMLDLSYVYVKSFPETIDRLLLLRYLNLSNNSSLEVLPSLIIRLYNLQTLILRYCKNLREVPKDFSSLINLRHLDLYGCYELDEMPLSILKLSNLRVLPYFVTSNEIPDDELKVLQQVFTGLKGRIDIILNKVNDTGRRLVVLKTHKGEWVISEGVLKKLELPHLIKELNLFEYNGKTMPWLAKPLPQYLICINIVLCDKLEQIPVFSKLPYLKSLELGALNSVEYMENEMSLNNNDIFFPSLKSFFVNGMTELKGWRKGDFTGMQYRFPRLSHLNLNFCCKLDLNVVCPATLETLTLYDNSERLLITVENPHIGLEKLRKIQMDHVNYLKLISPTNNCLTFLEFFGEIEMESALKCLQSYACASSLQTIILSDCKKLRKLPKLEHFIALEKLILRRNYELSICEEDDDEEPCKFFPPSLRYLEFIDLPKMKILPKGIQHLTSLQSMVISRCKGIKSLPKAIKDLTSLNRLSIYGCPDLKGRLKQPNGEDCSKIKHIPKIQIDGEDIMIE